MSAVDLLIARTELLLRSERPESLDSTHRLVAERRLEWADVEACCGIAAVLPVCFEGAWFDFVDGEGEPAVVIEVFDSDGETVIDLAAWPVTAPDRVRTMFGRASMLGLAAAENPGTYFLDRPLRVFQTATAWLKAGGMGCVILNAQTGARVLRDVPGRIAAENTAHAIELRAAIESLFDIERIVCPLTNMAA